LENTYEYLPRENFPISHDTLPRNYNNGKISLKKEQPWLDKGNTIATSFELPLAFGNTHTRHIPFDKGNISNNTYDILTR